MNSLGVVEFQSDHLLSKWGFDYGDLLMPILKRNGFPLIEKDDDFWVCFNSLVLCEVVECFVCAHITNRINPYRCATSHNPIRIYELEGKHVSDIPEDEINLTPQAIAVPESPIISLAEYLYQSRDQFIDQNGEWSYLIPSDMAKKIREQKGWE